MNKLETTLQLGVETDFSRQKWPPSHLDEIDRDLLASQVAQGSVTFCILFFVLFFSFEDLFNMGWFPIFSCGQIPNKEIPLIKIDK